MLSPKTHVLVRSICATVNPWKSKKSSMDSRCFNMYVDAKLHVWQKFFDRRWNL